MDLIDKRSVLLISSGIYIHWNKMCIVGLCAGGKPAIEPDLASVFIALSILMTMASQDLWPKEARSTNPCLVFLYEWLVTLAVLDICIRLIWAPLVPLFPNVGLTIQILNELLAMSKDSILGQFGGWLQTETGAAALCLLFAGWFFYEILIATGTFNAGEKFYRKAVEKYLSSPACRAN